MNHLPAVPQKNSSDSIETPVSDRLERGRPQTPVVLGLSLAAHGLGAWILGHLPIAPIAAARAEVPFEVLVAPAEPEPVIEEAPVEEPPPPVEAPPEPLVARPREIARPSPTVAPPVEEPVVEPPPAVDTRPPSLDDVFGAEAAGPAAVLTSGVGAGGVASGSGVPGGHGHGTATGGHGGVAAAPAVDLEAQRRRARRDYVRALSGLLQGRARYPRAAERDHIEGRVELCLRIGTSGEVLGVRVCDSSGAAILDDAATEAAESVGRVPPPPPLAAWTPSDELRAGISFVMAR